MATNRLVVLNTRKIRRPSGLVIVRLLIMGMTGLLLWAPAANAEPADEAWTESNALADQAFADVFSASAGARSMADMYAPCIIAAVDAFATHLSIDQLLSDLKGCRGPVAFCWSEVPADDVGVWLTPTVDVTKINRYAIDVTIPAENPMGVLPDDGGPSDSQPRFHRVRIVLDGDDEAKCA